MGTRGRERERERERLSFIHHGGNVFPDGPSRNQKINSNSPRVHYWPLPSPYRGISNTRTHTPTLDHSGDTGVSLSQDPRMVWDLVFETPFPFDPFVVPGRDVDSCIRDILGEKQKRRAFIAND